MVYFYTLQSTSLHPYPLPEISKIFLYGNVSDWFYPISHIRIIFYEYSKPMDSYKIYVFELPYTTAAGIDPDQNIPVLNIRCISRIGDL